MRLREYGENVMKFLVAVTALAAVSSCGTAAFAQSQGIQGGTQNHGPYGSPALSDRARVLPVSDMAGPGVSAALPPHEVITIIRSMGFDPASRPVLRGPVWVVRAFDDQDLLVRVAVDARTGRVVNVAEARRVAAYGDPRDTRDDAYPVPPASIPGGRVVEETEEVTTLGPQVRTYPEETYDERVYRTPSPRSVAPPANGYRPAPYVPSPHTSAQPASHPKVATRTPAPAKPAAPKVKSQAVSPAPPQAAAPAPQEKPPAVAQRAPDSSTSKEAAHGGVSIPAPVAHKAAPPEHADTAPAAPPADKKADDKTDDLKLVPVAPLE
jgi:hypothetical protein